MKKRMIVMLCTIAALLMVLVAILLVPINTPQASTTPNNTQTKTTTNKQYVFPDIPGITYTCDNENLHKYIYLVQTSATTYYVYSQAVHLDTLQDSMTIDEEFTQTPDSTFVNDDKSIMFTIGSAETLSVQDHRSNPIMPMTGLYRLSKHRKQTTVSAPVVIDVFETTPLEEGDTLSGNYVEHETYTMKCRFMENIDCNGMKFQSTDNTVFYVFGGQMSDKSGTEMELELVYRGQNPRYNGYDFGGTEEQCFNLVKRLKN